MMDNGDGKATMDVEKNNWADDCRYHMIYSAFHLPAETL
jgi:hypothetical protein